MSVPKERLHLKSKAHLLKKSIIVENKHKTEHKRSICLQSFLVFVMLQLLDTFSSSAKFKSCVFHWIMIEMQLSFKFSDFHVNYFTILRLITTFSTDVTKSLQCKGIILSSVTWRHACNVSSL